MTISGYWKTLKDLTIALRAIPQQQFQKCFQSW
jgi:hypothetical protein